MLIILFSWLVEELSAKELEERCKAYLELRVTNAKKLAALIEDKLGYTNYKVLPGERIQIFEGIDNPEKFSELAINNKIGLLALEEKTLNLENYYMSLIGGSEND